MSQYKDAFQAASDVIREAGKELANKMNRYGVHRAIGHTHYNESRSKWMLETLEVNGSLGGSCLYGMNVNVDDKSFAKDLVSFLVEKGIVTNPKNIKYISFKSEDSRGAKIKPCSVTIPIADIDEDVLDMRLSQESVVKPTPSAPFNA